MRCNLKVVLDCYSVNRVNTSKSQPRSVISSVILLSSVSLLVPDCKTLLTVYVLTLIDSDEQSKSMAYLFSFTSMRYNDKNQESIGLCLHAGHDSFIGGAHDTTVL